MEGGWLQSPVVAVDVDVRGDEQAPLKKLRREDKALHPSWEAKKRMKEKEPAAIIPSAGNKIVF